MQDVGFCIGNGTSREFFDLTRLDGHGVTVACNTMYKTYTPNYLVALDTGIRAELEELPKPTPWKWISRQYHDRICYMTVDGICFAPRSTFNGGKNNNSGVVAAAFLAERLQVKKLYMLGIDFFRFVKGRESNDLLGPPTNGTPTLWKIWNFMAMRNPKTEFIRVGVIDTYDRSFYDNDLKGFTLMSYVDFPY
jgi:hypothetical protein